MYLIHISRLSHRNLEYGVFSKVLWKWLLFWSIIKHEIWVCKNLSTFSCNRGVNVLLNNEEVMAFSHSPLELALKELDVFLKLFTNSSERVSSVLLYSIALRTLSHLPSGIVLRTLSRLPRGIALRTLSHLPSGIALRTLSHLPSGIALRTLSHLPSGIALRTL